MDNKVNVTKDSHVCEHGKCSCCGGQCAECGNNNWGHYYISNRLLVLIFATLLAFFVGMKVGEHTGFFRASYGEYGIHRSNWMLGEHDTFPKELMMKDGNMTGKMMINGGTYTGTPGTVNNK